MMRLMSWKITCWNMGFVLDKAGYRKKNGSSNGFAALIKQRKQIAELDIQKRINCYRRQVVQALKEFDTTMRQAQTVQEQCEVPM